MKKFYEVEICKGAMKKLEAELAEVQSPKCSQRTVTSEDVLSYANAALKALWDKGATKKSMKYAVISVSGDKKVAKAYKYNKAYTVAKILFDGKRFKFVSVDRKVNYPNRVEHSYIETVKERHFV